MMSAEPPPVNGASDAANGASRDANRPQPSSTIAAVENAAELSFGTEFDADVQILSNAQVAVILQMSAQNALVRDEELHDVYKKTQNYVDRFNTMKNKEKEHQELVDELDNLQGAARRVQEDPELRRSVQHDEEQ